MLSYKNPVPSIDSFESKKEIDSKLEDTTYTCNNFVYFAFIDVLGFKQEFDSSRITERRPENPNKFEQIFTYFFKLMSSATFIQDSRTPCYAGQTSDSLYFYTERPDYLLRFIKIFSHFNLYAMSKDVFFRGGIAKGDLYYKEMYQFYGNSVINAYLLEDEISQYPIVTIDKNTFRDLESYPECIHLVDFMKGRHYLKPFASLKNQFDLELESFIIKEIDTAVLRNNLERNLSKFEYNAKTYEKYSFLFQAFENINQN